MILVEDNEYILRYITFISEYKFKITKRENINKLKKESDLYFLMINDLEDLKKFRGISRFVVVFIKNVDKNILWSIHKVLNCIDVIDINNNTESILERIRSNIRKGEFSEKVDNNF